MATRSKKRRPPKTSKTAKARPVRSPKTRDTREGRSWWPLAAIAVALAAAAVLAVVLTQRGGGDGGASGGGAPVAGLPNTPDYHSLLVARSDPNALLLGTHQGLYRSQDGGRSWSFEGLSGQDAMNLAWPSTNVVWAAGHNVLMKSTDGGHSWQDVRPDGLPGLDVHGFAVDPRNERIVYAAIAGQGLYRSSDGGQSFATLSPDVGGAVMALAITRDGRILAGDMQQGLLVSRDGKQWTQALGAQLMGLAVNPKQPKLVLAAGAGVFRSTDGGRSWKQTFELADGAGPLAWAPSQPNVAYLVGFDRTLYKTTDAGASWQPVT